MRYITNLDLTFLKLSETGDCAISKDGYSQMSKVWKSIEKIKPICLMQVLQQIRNVFILLWQLDYFGCPILIYARMK